MILSKRVALNGQQLDDLHERIVIRSFDAGVPHEEIEAVSIQNLFGQRIASSIGKALMYLSPTRSTSRRNR